MVQVVEANKLPPWPVRAWRRGRTSVWIIVLFLALQPVTYAVIRVLRIGVVLALLYLSARWCWRRLAVHARVRRYAPLGITLLALGVCLILLHGNHPPDAARLQATYVRCLLSYRGAPYVWGGETHWGIDCSGLARCALWDAMQREGGREGNPRLLGIPGWQFWWRDMTAADLRDGKYGYTHVVGSADHLAGATVPDLRAGDLAVTSNGMHVLIYLGDARWIEADGDAHRVRTVRCADEPEHAWFHLPMMIMRWRVLDS